MTSAQRVRALAIDRGGLIAVVALAGYVAIAPRHIVGDGDNAEFATIGALGGIPHPSGYPAYVLWLRLMSWLPGATPAHTAAIATAILGAVTILVLHAACRAWGARPLAATLAVAIFAAAPVVLRVVTEAEVFALNSLVVASVLWLSARRGPLRGTKRVVALGLVAGLGLADHMTCAFVAPIGILGLVRGVRESSLPKPASLAIACAALGVGLLPYAYFLVAPTTPISWRRIDGVADIVHHALRLDYGLGTLSATRDPVPLQASLGALVHTLGRTWLWAPLLLGLAVLGLRSARGDTDAAESRWSWWALAASFVLAGPLLISRFNIPPEGVGLVLCQRFHVLPVLLLAIPVAVGFDEIGARLAVHLSPRARSSSALGSCLAIAACAALALRSLPLHSPAVERAAINMLRPLPQAAVVIVSEDDLYFGAGYVQLVLGERPDVTVISQGQLLNPEYRGRLHERSGIVMVTPGDKLASTTIAVDVLAHGRPMFVDSVKNNALMSLPSYPFGMVFRVLPAGAPRPPILDVFTLNKTIYDSFDLAYAPPGPDDDYATHAHERYARIWQIIARALGAAGLREQAAIAEQMTNTLTP